MYNRYVPQPDGSFQRNWIPDPPQQPPAPPPGPPPDRPQEPKVRAAGNTPRRPPTPPPMNPPMGLGGFFRQLLPKDFGTEDLLIVLLLLLMSGDSKEDQNTALLTLALYLFL